MSPANEFALLDRLGGDVAGADIAVGRRAPSPSPRDSPLSLNDAGSAAIPDAVPRRPMLAGDDHGLRLSLADAQAKLPVVLFDGGPALPAPGQPTTHIVKPEIAAFRGSVTNEAKCMALPRVSGLTSRSKGAGGERAPVSARHPLRPRTGWQADRAPASGRCMPSAGRRGQTEIR